LFKCSFNRNTSYSAQPDSTTVKQPTVGWSIRCARQSYTSVGLRYQEEIFQTRTGKTRQGTQLTQEALNYIFIIILHVFLRE